MFSPSMIDQYYDVVVSEAGGDYRYLDYGFGDTSYSVGPDQFDIDDELSPYRPYAEYADFIGHVSELPSDVEIGTPPVQYSEIYGGEKSGISFYEMPDEEFERLDPNFLRTALKVGSLLGGGQPPKNRLMSKLPSRRELGRQYGSPVGSVPGGLGSSRLSAEQTQMLQLANFIKKQAADTRLQSNLDNFPLPRIGQTPSASGAVDLSKGGFKPTLAKRRRQTQSVYSTA